jgi:hypothetical protein
MAIEGGMAPRGRIQPPADQSVTVPDGEEDVEEGEAALEGGDEGLWDAPEEDETREDDRWRRGDWGDNAGVMESLGLRELTFNDLPLAQCRRLVTNSDNRLRVEDWVIRHACRCQQLGEYRHEPDLEGGGDDSASHCSSSTYGALLSVSSSSDSALQLAGADSDNKVAGGAESSARKPRQPNSGNSLREEVKALDSRQVRVNRERFAAGGVTRAAWKTGSFATPRREPVQGIFSSLLGGGVGSPAEKGISSYTVVEFCT